jgi:hypothetical protein
MFFVDAKLHNNQETDIAESTLLVAKNLPYPDFLWLD